MNVSYRETWTKSTCVNQNLLLSLCQKHNSTKKAIDLFTKTQEI